MKKKCTFTFIIVIAMRTFSPFINMTTKKKTCKWFILFVALMTPLSSCDKDKLGVGAIETDFATIYAKKGEPLTLIPDRGQSIMYITKTVVNKKELTHQRRVIATYTLLKDVTPKNLADLSYWNIRLDQISDLECKLPVLKSHVEDPNQLGKGILRIKSIDMARHFLNIILYEHAGDAPNINLWFDDSNHPASDTWIFVLSSDAATTTQGVIVTKYISFDLQNLFRDLQALPTKLILRYFESTDTQKELRYTIHHDLFGICLIPEE